MFHFNKKHLEDQTIPMWVLKTHGETFYVHHVDCEMPWSTKETPDNSHTKGSLKMKECHLIIDEKNNATLKKLTLINKMRLSGKRPDVARIILSPRSPVYQALANNEYEHSKFKFITGACSSAFAICDISKRDLTFIMLKYGEVRVLKPNEHYYIEYDGNSKHVPVDYSDRSTPYEYS